MNRRNAAVVLVAVPVGALPAWAQGTRKKMRIGFLSGATPDPTTLHLQIDSLRDGLRELGWIEGQHYSLEPRWAEGRLERLPALAAELLALDLDVLVTGGLRPPLVAQAATTTVPIIAVAIDDPVAMGLAQSMARPGSNITGVSSSVGIEIVAKRLQLLRELAPAARRYAVLMNPLSTDRADLAKSLARFERSLGVEIQIHEGRAGAFDAAFAELARNRVGGLLIFADPIFWIERAKLVELCIRDRLPTVWGGRDWARAGGLVSYQGDFAAAFRRSAALIDKVLKGGKPAEIPFELPTKLELVVNLKTARAMGLTIPPSVLVSADEVIE